MKKVTYKAIYNRKNKLNSEGKGLIQIECYLNRKRKYISTGIKIEKVYWNNKLNIVRNNHPENIELNRLIKQQIRAIEDFEFNQIEKNGDFSLNEITGFNYKDNSGRGSFIEFIKENIVSNTAINKSTKSHHKVVLKKLEEFKSDILFDDISYSLIKDFDDFLRSQTLLHVNSIANHHKTIKAYINLAIKKNLFSVEKYPYRQFKVRKIKTQRVYLTLEEVEAISKIVFTDSTWHVEFIRDMFLFSCYTGLRFSDVQSLQNKHVTKEGKDYYIEIRMNKTQGIVKLPISLLFKGKAVDIVKKYINKNPEEDLFPRISNQKANVKLKVVSVIAKIDKNLTFHVSRHTFGTNLAAATTDQFLIKELMGHTDIKTSMTYIHTSQEHIKNKLKNTDWG